MDNEIHIFIFLIVLFFIALIPFYTRFKNKIYYNVIDYNIFNQDDKKRALSNKRRRFELRYF